MALTVGTDSYVTVAEAEAYATEMGLTFAGTTAENEAALRRATQWVDATYRHRFPGSRTNGRSQALEWPRDDAEDAAGNEIADTVIPVEIERATMEAAVRELASPNSLLPDVKPSASKILTRVEGTEWKAMAQSGAQSVKPVLHVVDGILAPLIGGKSGRLLRA